MSSSLFIVMRGSVYEVLGYPFRKSASFAGTVYIICLCFKLARWIVEYISLSHQYSYFLKNVTANFGPAIFVKSSRFTTCVSKAFWEGHSIYPLQGRCPGIKTDLSRWSQWNLAALCVFDFIDITLNRIPQWRYCGCRNKDPLSPGLSKVPYVYSLFVL